MDSSTAVATPPRALEATLSAVAEPTRLRARFAALRRDAALLRDVAARSYAHENGFFKVVLEEEAGRRLRLHVWRPQDSVGAQENVHDHRWDFASVVLRGELRTDAFAIEADPHRSAAVERCFAYRYCRPAEGLGYRLEALGRRNVRLARTLRLRAGDAYSMPAEAYHRIVHDSGVLTATLVLTDTPRSRACHLLSRTPLPPKGDGAARRLTPQRLVALLDELEEAA